MTPKGLEPVSHQCMPIFVTCVLYATCRLLPPASLPRTPSRQTPLLHSALRSRPPLLPLRAPGGSEAQQIPVEWFQQGLEIKLEHGLQYPNANVTNNHPILTGKIVLAHLKEMLDYYLRLDVAELEGDLLKASNKGDVEKLSQIYKKLIAARAALNQWEKSEVSA